ncbi:MAG TPA: phosphatidylinositol mannoside acyltransferase [Acidimicrobiia bacterium]|nr:phosphatidylinositol mannoside acyltransferase [Acidimicrobiia bacterium]
MSTSGPAATAVYLGYRAGAAVALALPESFSRPAAGLTGRALGLAMRGRRQMVGRHLRRIHGPGLDGRALDRAVNATFASYGRYWLEAFRLPRQDLMALDGDRFRVEGKDHVDRALAGGRGVVIGTPHLGNWDLGAAWFAARGYQPTTVVEPIEPPELFEWFCSYRRALGVGIVPLGPDAGSLLLKKLREGLMVGLVCDRDLAGTGIEVDFFSERTTFPAGPATLALRAGAPLLAGANYFTGDAHHCVITAPLDTGRQGTIKEDIARITQALAATFEDLIRRAPEQWHMLQPNWPSDFALSGAVREGRVVAA